MTTLISISTLQIVTREQLQQLFPNTSFVPDFSVVSAADWAPYGVAPLTYTQQPNSQFYSVTMGAPTANADGTYSTTWVQTPIDLEQAKQIQLNTLSAYTQNIAWADVTYNGATIPTNATCGVIMAHVASGTASITFKGENGVFIQVGPTDAAAIQTLMTNQLGMAFQIEAQIAQQINALATVDTVAAFDIASTWTAAQTALTS